MLVKEYIKTKQNIEIKKEVKNMEKKEMKLNYEEMAKNYFSYIKDLRSGKEGAIKKLLDLWDKDGIFEFAGDSPVVGTFKGKNAIRVLYKNRLNSSRMAVKLEGKESEIKKNTKESLDIVDTEPKAFKVKDGSVIAGWTTLISTKEGHGFRVPGNHTFTFKDGKINNLKITMSSKVTPVADLTLEGLSVRDIGRLALAAWPVV